MPVKTDTQKPAQVSSPSLLGRVTPRSFGTNETTTWGHYPSDNIAYLTEPEDRAVYALRIWTEAQTDERLRASLAAWESVQFNALSLRQEDSEIDHMTQQERADFAGVLRLHATAAARSYGRGQREPIPRGDVSDYLGMLPDDFEETIQAIEKEADVREVAQMVQSLEPKTKTFVRNLVQTMREAEASGKDVGEAAVAFIANARLSA